MGITAWANTLHQEQYCHTSKMTLNDRFLQGAERTIRVINLFQSSNQTATKSALIPSSLNFSRLYPQQHLVHLADGRQPQCAGLVSKSLRVWNNLLILTTRLYLASNEWYISPNQAHRIIIFLIQNFAHAKQRLNRYPMGKQHA